MSCGLDKLDHDEGDVFDVPYKSTLLVLGDSVSQKKQGQYLYSMTVGKDHSPFT